MAKNRQLTEQERDVARGILRQVRERITEATKGDQAYTWALRRYLYIRLMHDERGNPTERKKLKFRKMVEQEAKCAECGERLPEQGSELDRLDAMSGYTSENVRLVCHSCHRRMQAEKGFS
jgi:ribosomal protein L44E